MEGDGGRKRARVSTAGGSSERDANAPATSPTSATWKMGASGSCGDQRGSTTASHSRTHGITASVTLLIATIVLESFMPARC